MIADRVFMSGASRRDIATGMFANTTGPGDAGGATVRTGHLELREGARIATGALDGSGSRPVGGRGGDGHHLGHP